VAGAAKGWGGASSGISGVIGRTPADLNGGAGVGPQGRGHEVTCPQSSDSAALTRGPAPDSRRRGPSAASRVPTETSPESRRSALIEQLRLEAVKALDQDRPVTMLNLMRFRAGSLDGDGSGWDAYLRYSRQASRLIKERGGRIVWAGELNGVPFGPEEHGQWDYTALVYYPSPAAFLDMMQSPAYAEANVHRENGCRDHLIMAVDETYNGMSQ